MKILMLNYEFPPIGGGAAKAHLYILKEYAKIPDLKVDVLTSGPNPGFYTEAFSDNICIYKVGLHKKSFHYWRKVEVLEWLFKSPKHYDRLISQKNYDLVHSFFAFPSAYHCYKTVKKLPYIVSLRGSDVPGYNVRLGLDYKILSGLFRKIWNSASVIVANSEGLKQLAQKFTPDIDIGVIPNGIDTNVYYPKENKIFEKPIKLLTVCRLISRKRIDLLIEAVAHLKNRDVDVVFNIVGEGNLMLDLKHRSEQLGVSGIVNFLGRIRSENMPAVYRENDIFIMSSQHEGMSNAMLEAMASGLPIITTNCEGVEELIDNNGIIVESDTAESFSDAIFSVCRDMEACKKMTEHALHKSASFSWEKCAEKYIDIYNHLARKDIL